MNITKLSLFVLLALLISFLGIACDDSTNEQKPTLTGSVNIGGVAEVGETLTANIVGSNGTIGKFTYQWTRTPEGGTALEITNENGHQYTITEADIGRTLGVIVSNDDTTGTISGAQTSRVPEPILEPDVREFPVEFDFHYPSGAAHIRNAVILDERIQPGSPTLQDLGIVQQIEDAIMGAFETVATTNGMKSLFRTVFGRDVTIIVDNPAAPYKMKATDDETIYFHIDYLRNNPADIEQHIFDAIRHMALLEKEYPFVISQVIGRDAVRLANVPGYKMVSVTHSSSSKEKLC